MALPIRKKQGHLFGGGYDTKYLAVVSNRRELPAPELIRWHWEKAGTIEHVHDVTKNDLAAAVPPCGRFGANAAWYRLSLLTYNVLSAMKWLALPPSMETARPKRMRFSLSSRSPAASSRTRASWCCASGARPRRSPRSSRRASRSRRSASPASPPRPHDWAPSLAHDEQEHGEGERVSTRGFSSGSPLSREGERGRGGEVCGKKMTLGLAVAPAAAATERQHRPRSHARSLPRV